MSTAEPLVLYRGLLITKTQREYIEALEEQERQLYAQMAGVSLHSRGQAVDINARHAEARYAEKRDAEKRDRFAQLYGQANRSGSWPVRDYYLMRLGGVFIDGVEIKVTYRPTTGRWATLGRSRYWGVVAFELYDHVVTYYDPASVYHRTKPRVECACGWKNGGDDCGTRAEAHIRKLREWLDEHPEEEVVAALGGSIAWPKKQPQSRKKKAFKKQRRR